MPLKIIIKGIQVNLLFKEGAWMNVSDKTIQLAKENNGVVTTAALSENRILRGNLKKLVDDGKLEKTARGVYILLEIWEDEFVNLQARFKKGFFPMRQSGFYGI